MRRSSSRESSGWDENDKMGKDYGKRTLRSQRPGKVTQFRHAEHEGEVDAVVNDVIVNDLVPPG